MDSRGSPLDARAVDEDVNLAAHRIKRLLEEPLDALEVREVAFDHLDAAACSGDGVDGLVVGGAGAADETDVGAGLGEGDRAGGADAWRGRIQGASERGEGDCVRASRTRFADDTYRGWRL